MSESRRVPKKQHVKKVVFFTGLLRCQRDGLDWFVVDLNTEHKTVKCPVCGEQNGIREARNLAQGITGEAAVAA